MAVYFYGKEDRKEPSIVIQDSYITLSFEEKMKLIQNMMNWGFAEINNLNKPKG
jgi:hypothetical protein